jgi:hypothetical protein
MTKWKTTCPRCKREGQIEMEVDNPPLANCGDCLFDHVEVVEMIVTRLYRFKVCVQQYVEETAAIYVDAVDPNAAVAIADQKLADGDVDNWQAGDDFKDREVYAVLDNRGDSVWER